MIAARAADVPGQPAARLLPALAAVVRLAGPGDAPHWRGYLGGRDGRHGVGEGGEVEAGRVVHDVFAHAGQVDRVSLARTVLPRARLGVGEVDDGWPFSRRQLARSPAADGDGLGLDTGGLPGAERS